MDGSNWHRYWQAWETHCRLHHNTPGAILPPHILTDWLLTFAVAVQEGQHGNKHQVQIQSIAKALQLISQELVLDRHPHP